MQRLRWATLLRPGFSRARRAVLAAACVVVISAVLAVVFTRSTHEPRTPAEPSSGSSAVRPSISIPPFANWPDAATTGVPVSARSSLKHVTSLDVDKDGAVYSHLDVTGCVDVRASNVTITQSIIRCAGNRPVIHVIKGSTGLVLDQVELDGAGKASACIAFGDFKIYRSNLHDCADGVDFTSNVVVASCYIHDLARGPNTHNDVLQTPGGSNDLIVDNTLQAYRADSHDPMNAAIQTGKLDSSLSNVTVRHNYLDGGNYTVNAGASSTNGHSISDYTITENVFGRHFRYGPVQSIGDGTVFDNTNVWADDGQPVKG